jgi:hypothetical protein
VVVVTVSSRHFELSIFFVPLAGGAEPVLACGFYLGVIPEALRAVSVEVAPRRDAFRRVARGAQSHTIPRRPTPSSSSGGKCSRSRKLSRFCASTSSSARRSDRDRDRGRGFRPMLAAIDSGAELGLIKSTRTAILSRSRAPHVLDLILTSRGRRRRRRWQVVQRAPPVIVRWCRVVGTARLLPIARAATGAAPQSRARSHLRRLEDYTADAKYTR